MNRIREIRKARGLTMKELGAAIGLAESTISQYETGKRQPDNETLLSLAEQLGVTVGYLLGAEEPAADPAINRLRNLLGQIPPDRYDDAETILRLIIEAGKKR